MSTSLNPWRRDLAALLRLTGPVAAARLGVMAMGLTDAVVVGRYSAEQLGFQALGWTLPAVVLVGAMGFLSGVQVMTARYLGEGRPELTGGVLGSHYSDIFAFIVLIFVLTLRPSGLLGERVADRA